MTHADNALPPYLAACPVIDWQHPAVFAMAKKLAAGLTGDLEIARACFEFVRDEVTHSLDARQNPVTCAASEVLEHHTGYCYAKSHLLAALLRANGIPAGLCYQRLRFADDQPEFCLHGLNAVYLRDFGWYRVDARGNKPGVQAAFSPPDERLAFPIREPGEADLPEIWPEPLDIVVKALRTGKTYDEVAQRLPDVMLLDLAQREARRS